MSRLTKEAMELWRSRSLLLILTKREFASRYAGFSGGTVWAYVQPLLVVAAYYLVFDVVFAMRLSYDTQTKGVGTYLIVGMIPWMAFCEAVTRAMHSFTESATLLQKNPLPLALFPLRSVLASSIVFMPLMAVLVALYSPLHQFNISLLSVPALLILQIVLCSLIGYLLAIFNAALRDTTQVVTFALSVGVFLSPVLFPVEMFPADWQWVLWLNPMSVFIQCYQSLLLQGNWPQLSHLIVIGIWILATALVLNQVLNRSAEQLVDWL